MHRMPVLLPLAVAVLVAGCTSPGSVGTDIDLDGIPDASERGIAEEGCFVEGWSCEELGLEPPRVGTRDLVLVEVRQPTDDPAVVVSDAVYGDVRDEFARLGVHVQRATLHVDHAPDVEGSWEDPENDQSFWFVWVTYGAPQEDAAGTSVFNWIELLDDSGPEQQRLTLFHEIYHALLGDLDENHSECPDPELGGAGHSRDPESSLYQPADCDGEQEDVRKYRLTAAEETELEAKPFEELTLMNAPGWTHAGWA